MATLRAVKSRRDESGSPPRRAKYSDSDSDRDFHDAVYNRGGRERGARSDHWGHDDRTSANYRCAIHGIIVWNYNNQIISVAITITFWRRAPFAGCLLRWEPFLLGSY